MNSVWMWAAVAVLLLIGEMLTATFGLLFFGVAAMTTALAVWVFPALSPSFQVLIFGVLGLVGLVFARKWIKARLAESSAPAVRIDDESEFIVDRDLAPGAEGAVTYQGAPWSARNEGSSPIRAGDRVRILRTSGIKLVIESKK